MQIRPTTRYPILAKRPDQEKKIDQSLVGYSAQLQRGNMITHLKKDEKNRFITRKDKFGKFNSFGNTQNMERNLCF